MADSNSVRMTLEALSREEPFFVRTLNIHHGTSVPIGRASSCASKGLIASPENAYFNCAVVSRKHAEVLLETDHIGIPSVSIVDSGSMHGTYLNQQKLVEGAKNKLADDDVLKLGCDVQRNLERFRPLEYIVKLDFSNFHRMTEVGKPTDPQARSFEVPDSTSSEYDTNDFEESDLDDGTSPSVEPPSPAPYIKDPTTIDRKDFTANAHSNKDILVEDSGCCNLSGPKEHNESNVPDSFAQFSNSPVDGIQDASSNVSEDSESADWDASEDDVVYSFKLPTKACKEDVPDSGDLNTSHQSNICPNPQFTYLKTSTFDGERDLIAANKSHTSDLKGKPLFESMTTGSAQRTADSVLPYWTPSSTGPRLIPMPPIQTYSASGSDSHLSAYPKIQDNPPNSSSRSPFCSNYLASSSCVANGDFYPRIIKSGNTLESAIDVELEPPVTYADMFGLDAHASFSAAPYQANRFDMSTSNPPPQKAISPIDKDEVNNRIEGTKSSQTFVPENPSSSPVSVDSVKVSEQSAKPAKKSIAEGLRQSIKIAQPSTGSDQPKSALRICDLVHSLGPKDNTIVNSVVGKKRKCTLDLTPYTTAPGSAGPSATCTRPSGSTKAREHGSDSVDTKSSLSLNGFTEEDLKALDEFDDLNDVDDFDEVDDFEGVTCVDEAESAIDEVPSAAAATVETNPMDQKKSISEDLKHTEISSTTKEDHEVGEFAQKTAHVVDGPSRKKVKLAPVSASGSVRPVARRSKIAAAASAFSWAAVGSVITLTALANLPETFFVS